MKTIINEFFSNYIENTLDVQNLFSDDVEIDYSTIGYCKGICAVKRALAINGDFTYKYSIISNVIEYMLDEKEIIILNGFHYLIKECNSYIFSSASSSLKGQVFPLVFGGKYKFTLYNNKIEKISFDLEAQMGNTYFAKTEMGFRLFEETQFEPRRVMLDKKAITSKLDTKEAIIQTINLLMLVADTKQIEVLSKITIANAELSHRDNTQAMSDSNERAMDKLSDYILHNKEKEAQPHHSYKLENLEYDEKTAEAHLQMFEPTKLGYKHLYSNTIYQPYYNEKWIIKLVKEETWKISSADKSAMSKLETIGFTTLEI